MEPGRFWGKVKVGKLDECWEWQAGKRSGYGIFYIRRRGQQAHRVAWALTYGPVPEGLWVLHKCDNPSCVNPCHLFLGTSRDNQVDSVRKGRRSTKLSEEDVLDIRELYASGEWSQRGLAKKFGVSRGAIEKVITRRKWAWLAG